MHRGHGWILCLGTTLIAVAALAQPAPPVTSVPLCERPPRLDGALDDACWRSAYSAGTFYTFKLGEDAYKRTGDTTLHLTTDGAWLYFGLECAHPTPDDMKATITANFGGRVFGDECIKLFIKPAVEGGGYFRYVLNFRNVHTLRRSFSEAGPVPNLAWPSATQVTDTGWMAEVAVPLFNMAGYADLQDFRLNVFRKKIIREYDAQHVEVGFNEYTSTWSATDEWLNPDEMGRLEGLAELTLRTPFVANARDVSVGELYEQDGAIRYDVTMTLMAMTSQAGEATVEVVETTLDGESRPVSETFQLEPRQVRPAEITVPVEALGERQIDVVIRDAATAMPFQTVQTADTSGFELLRAFARRNYYTDEAAARVFYGVGMPAEALADKRLVVTDPEGAELARTDGPDAKGELVLPLGEVAQGRHELTLTLQSAHDRRLSEVAFELVKLPSKPGCEWKVNRQTGALLDNGKPIFPIGFLTGYDEAQFAEIANAGFNTIVWWMGPDEVPLREVAQLAADHGLKLIVRPQKVPSRANEMKTLKRYFEGEEYQQAVYGCRSMLRLKSFLLGPLAARLTRAERNEISREFFDLHMPAILDNVRSVRDMPNLIGYDTLDEPVFNTADQYLDLRRMYLAVKDVDPYRPMYALYSSNIPAGPEATSFGDCLGTDPYWTPGRTLPRGSINWMSTTTATTVARAAEVGQHPWTVPDAALWSDVIKRMLSGEEQICQTWLALIHGTKSVFYFTHGWVALQSQWDAMKTLAERINELSPALTAAKPPQQISYEPGTWAPLKGEVPDVQARLIRYPDGRNVLLAANVRRSAVEVAITVQGLQDQRVRDMFQGEIGPVADGTFTDTLQARGVRAWTLRHVEGDGPVRISVQITALGDEGTIEDGYRHEGRVGQKNILPNGSFEQATVEGFPDYYWPYHSADGSTGWRHRIGAPDGCMALSTDGVYHGEQFMRIQPRRPEVTVGLFLRTVAPQHDAAQPYVFSFYARTDRPEPVSVSIKAYGRNLPDVVVGGPEWTRYAVPLEVPARADGHSWLLIRSDAQVDIDALQFEQGQQPTEFQP